MCRPLSRRELIRYAGLLAATPLAVPGSRLVRAFGDVASRAVPMHLELVTLTETSAVFTWFTGDPNDLDEYGRPRPLPADTSLLIGESPLAMREVAVPEETAYHHVEVTGLRPATRYFYRARSNGLDAVPTDLPGLATTTGSFVTPLPPPGEHVLTMAWVNDLHIGETVSGLAYSNGSLPGGGFPPGFPVDPANPYPQLMAQAAVAEAKQRGARLMLVNGDLTSEAEPADVAEAKRILDGFGTHRDDYWVARGNHDRAHSGAAWATCSDPDADGANDCLADAFFDGGPGWFSFQRQRLRFIGLDTNDASGNGAIAAEQWEWLEAELADTARPTFVFGHHPVSEQSSVTAIPPVVFTLNPQDAQRLEQRVAESSVVGVYSAHTHRNKRTSSVLAPGVPFMEVGATKEYPGGYALVRVHTGGYAVNFHKTSAPDARAWSERSRGEYLGLYPYYTLGDVSDRNFVVEADLSDLRPGTRP